MFDVENPSESVQDMSQVFKISSSVHVLVNAIFLDLCHIVVILSYKTYKILISAYSLQICHQIIGKSMALLRQTVETLN